MQSIIQVFREGSVRDQLALAADILSILGVSLAAVVGGALTLSTRLNVGNTVFALMVSLLVLAGAAVVLVGFLAASSWLSDKSSFNGIHLGLLQFSVWACFAALFLLVAFGWYDFMSSFSFSK